MGECLGGRKDSLGGTIGFIVRDGAQEIAIYISLPHEVLRLFLDFVQVLDEALPRETALVYGDMEAFHA